MDEQRDEPPEERSIEDQVLQLQRDFKELFDTGTRIIGEWDQTQARLRELCQMADVLAAKVCGGNE